MDMDVDNYVVEEGVIVLVVTIVIIRDGEMEDLLSAASDGEVLIIHDFSSSSSFSCLSPSASLSFSSFPCSPPLPLTHNHSAHNPPDKRWTWSQASTQRTTRSRRLLARTTSLEFLLG